MVLKIGKMSMHNKVLQGNQPTKGLFAVISGHKNKLEGILTSTKLHTSALKNI